jgi:hypothetical protein
MIMKNSMFKKSLFAAGILLGAGLTQVTSAHDAAGVIDSGGNNASSTDFAAVNCFNDGSGPPDHLAIQIEDLSPPVPGMLMSMQVSKDRQMTNVTDPTSGDGNASPFGIVKGGAGQYLISATKTAAGLRNFKVTFHCRTSGNDHTGTSENPDVYQLQ